MLSIAGGPTGSNVILPETFEDFWIHAKRIVLYNLSPKTAFAVASSGFKMAPLLGRKPYPLAKPLTEPPGPGDEIYTIEHTKEAFRNKEYPLSWCCLLDMCC